MALAVRLRRNWVRWFLLDEMLCFLAAECWRSGRKHKQKTKKRIALLLGIDLLFGID